MYDIPYDIFEGVLAGQGRVVHWPDVVPEIEKKPRRARATATRMIVVSLSRFYVRHIQKNIESKAPRSGASFRVRHAGEMEL